MRVVHLLEHTTGFDDLHLREYSFGPDDGSLRDALEVNPAPRTARWPPGTRMAYNNGGSGVAARLIEKITGDRFDAHVEREIMRPLGMGASGFGLERIGRNRLTVHHLSGGDVERTVPYPLLVRPAGGFIRGARTFLGDTFLDDTPLGAPFSRGARAAPAYCCDAPTRGSSSGSR